MYPFHDLIGNAAKKRQPMIVTAVRDPAAVRK
jgi:hypothetical protein